MFKDPEHHIISYLWLFWIQFIFSQYLTSFEQIYIKNKFDSQS